jgi:hypothetical protein
LHCVENRVVNFRICRACAKLPAPEFSSNSVLKGVAA